MADNPNKYNPEYRRERAMSNLTALSVFYGFFFVFAGSLSTLTIYIADNLSEVADKYYTFLLMIAFAQSLIGWGLRIEAQKAEVAEFLVYGLATFVYVVPVFYLVILSAILSIPELPALVSAIAFYGALILVIRSFPRQ